MIAFFAHVAGILWFLVALALFQVVGRTLDERGTELNFFTGFTLAVATIAWPLGMPLVMLYEYMKVSD